VPVYLVVASGKSYFILSEGYLLAGQAEDPKHYLWYCRVHGTFRTTRVPIPTRDQALKDLAQLRRSKAWKAIEWSGQSDYGSSSVNEEQVLGLIKAQADEIPAN
jgi:hypothetical protein